MLSSIVVGAKLFIFGWVTLRYLATTFWSGSGLWITERRQLLVHDAGESDGEVVHRFTVSKHDCLKLSAEVAVCGRLPHLFILSSLPDYALDNHFSCGHRASRVHERRDGECLCLPEGKLDGDGELSLPLDDVLPLQNGAFLLVLE